MHIIAIPDDCPMPKGEYLIEDRNGAEIMLRAPGATMESWEGFPGPLKHQHLIHNPQKERHSILIVAPIGFGDSILLTPCLRAIKELHPSANLTIATFQEYRQPYLGLPYVDGFDDYPLPIQKLQNYDCVLFLERAIEFTSRAKEQHMTDRFAEHLGLGELKDKTADYRVTDMEREWILASFPRTAKRRIGIQIQAGARCRTYPRMTLMVEALRREGWEVGLLGAPGEFSTAGPDRPEIIDLSKRGLTWRQSVAFLTTCDVFLGPDSSMLHAAGALNVPAVGVFGPYPWKLRTAYYKSVHAIQGTEGCTLAPCFHVTHLGLSQFPANGPCAATGRCTVLESILPQRILALVEKQANAGRAAGSLAKQEPPLGHSEAHQIPEPDSSSPESPS